MRELPIDFRLPCKIKLRMAETLVENQICNACGVDVRLNALFCYNCGKSVAPEIIVEENDKKDKVSDVWLREKIIENGNKEKSEEKQVLEKSLTAETFADKPIPKPGIQEEAKLKSAATMRRKSTTFQKKTVEVVWEEHENAPNALFIIVALILTLLAAGILFLAMYLK